MSDINVKLGTNAINIKLSGSGSAILYSWTTATRPAVPFAGQVGWNTSHPGLEAYDAIRVGWVILYGTWTVSGRPNTSNILAGSTGYNTDTGYGLEMWDGTNWRLL